MATVYEMERLEREARKYSVLSLERECILVAVSDAIRRGLSEKGIIDGTASVIEALDDISGDVYRSIRNREKEEYRKVCEQCRHKFSEKSRCKKCYRNPYLEDRFEVPYKGEVDTDERREV